MAAIALGVLIAALVIGSIAAAQREKHLVTVRAASIIWMACVTLTPVAARIVPEYCERTGGGLPSAEIFALTGAILMTAICGFLSRLFIKRWILSLPAGALATLASYAAVVAIFYVLPEAQYDCLEF